MSRSYRLLKWLRLPLTWLAQLWIRAQQWQHYRQGEPLTPAMRQALAPWFLTETLNRVRIRRVARIHGPKFIRWLRWAGVPVHLEFQTAAGITFGNAVVITGKRSANDEAALLFHELVHVVQYAELGVAGFIDRYIRDWLETGCDYYAIPLERQAYGLEETFRADSALPISVEAAVREGALL